jgi:hypothetical protein
VAGVLGAGATAARRAFVVGLIVLCACSSSSASSSSSSSSSAARSDRSTIHTNGGTVVVRRGAHGLEVVELSTADGWEAHHEATGQDRLDVTFEREGSRVDVSVVLTPTGISSSTRSVSTS